VALASQRNRLRYGFVVTDKTECQKPQAIQPAAFLLVRHRLPACELECAGLIESDPGEGNAQTNIA
jgi:hypothetical protein